MSIIAISGYSGSGKDLVGRMIQYYTSPSSDPNEGHYRTFDQFVLNNGGSDARNFDGHYFTDWEIKKFAGKLKEIASLLTGIPVHKFEDQEFKKTNLGSEWNYIEKDFVAPGIWTKTKYMTVREFLQKLGTDGLRDGLHTNVWVNAMFADYECTHTDHVPGGFDCDNWIITDCRFPNEAQAVKDRNGIIIRIDRPGITAVNAHPSETSIDDWNFDDRIVNDGSVEDLLVKVKTVLEQQSILV